MAISRWIAPALAVSLVGGAFALPTPARAQSYNVTRAIVGIADAVLRGDQPYYSGDAYGGDGRLLVGRSGYVQEQGQRVKCNKHGKCTAEYYDPRYDRRGRDTDDEDRYDDDDRYGYGRHGGEHEREEGGDRDDD